jgi:Ca2+:H+ antiporter
MKFLYAVPLWTLLAPILGGLLLFFSSEASSTLYLICMGITLVGTVMASVHHAEVVAHKVGEPFGTLILAVAITIIEVAIIISLMISGGEGASTYARDTVFSAIMILITGLIGLCLMVGGVKYREQEFIKHGTNSALIALISIVTLTLIFPNYTKAIPGPFFNKAQMIFVAVVSLVIYGAFVAVQTVRHRNYFLPAIEIENENDPEIVAAKPSLKLTWVSLGVLIVCLYLVVQLAKKLSYPMEDMVASMGLPQSVVGLFVAAVILMPEGIAAYKNARRDRLQTSLNLCLGSALASIGLTIPCVAIASLMYGFDVTLGISSFSALLFGLSFFVLTISLGTGRTNILQGVVLLTMFAAYLFMTVVP